MPGLEVRDLTVRFGATTAVDAVDLVLPTGGVLAVLGPSGCGKSTLLRAVAGLEQPASGRISYDGQDLSRVPTHKRGFALMFQDGQLFGHQSVARNIGYPLRLRHRPAAETAARVDELLKLVGLDGYGDRRPDTLSGGERQRVALARALAVHPRLLLLDEPLSSLDRALRERLAADLRGIFVAANTTAVLVTHDQEEAFAVADHLAVMRAGRIVQQGTVAEVWQRPRDAWTALFLGYAGVLTGEPALRLRHLLHGPGSGSGSGAASWDAVALRRSAIRHDPDGPLSARVLAARQTPEQLRLELDVEGLGELAGVADPHALVAVGETIRVRVVTDRLAPLPDH